MRKFLAAIAFALSMSFSQFAQAAESVVVVELYTSQGCSSCPPADALLDKLAKRDNVIALALHVDYWDYIGWKDNFGSPAFTERQRSYARFTHQRSIYTPQMIIGGTDNVVGNRAMEIADAINAKSRNAPVANLEIVRKGGVIEISADAITNAKQPVLVQLVRYIPKQSVKITRGENAGRTILYSNIVTEWTEISQWNASKPLKIDAKVTGSEPIVVILQSAGPGQILAAARLR